jgi:hypothetical protein
MRHFTKEQKRKKNKVISIALKKYYKNNDGYWAGKKRPDMTGNKNPSKHLGIGEKISKAKKGKPNGRIGLKHTKETKKKIGEANSIALKGKYIGEDSYHWKGEEVCKTAYHIRARNIMRREGINIKGLQVHHKDGNWKNNKLENLQLLTQSEHRKLHNLDKKIKKQNGKRNCL